MTKPLALVAAAIAAVVAALFLIPSEKYIFLPDEPNAVAPVVNVEGEQPDDDGGGIYYLDILVRKAVLAERLYPDLREGSDIVPPEAVRPPGVDDDTRRQIDLRTMATSQEKAAAVALRELGYDVEADPEGALVTAVLEGTPAVGKLKPSDVIVGIDGETIETLTDVREALAEVEPGERVRLRVRDGEKLRRVTITTVENPQDPERAVIGVLIEQAARVDIPLDVEIDTGNVGGPSAGLAFALGILEDLGRDVDRGYAVAVTGEIELDGSVGPVGGVKQKAIGARRAGMDVLLVPAGDNAAVARRHAGSMRVFAVDNFAEALQKLATLPQKA